VNIHSSLIAELRDKTYRDAYVASQIRIGLPFQIRALRKAKDWTQDRLAEYAGMAQPRIAEIEKPGERRLNLDTLLRLAAAFDVALEVRFVLFSELIDRSEAFDPNDFTVKSFNEELSDAEQYETILASNDLVANVSETIMVRDVLADMMQQRVSGATITSTVQVYAPTISIQPDILTLQGLAPTVVTENVRIVAGVGAAAGFARSFAKSEQVGAEDLSPFGQFIKAEMRQEKAA